MSKHGPIMVDPVEKAKDFKGTLWRLARYLQPHKHALYAVIMASIISTIFNIVSPMILGKATTKLFDGIMLKAKKVAGAQVDFSYIGQILLILIGLYLISALFGYLQQYLMAGIAQKTVYTLRKDVNDKLARLPLSFFDARPHGEILSRAVNDVDNISNTLQQSLTQLITSVITLLGVTVMMLIISPILTVIVFATLPLSMWMTKLIASRSQNYFSGQQKSLGELNGHVEEMYSGHNVVKAFGHEKKSLQKFSEINDTLYHSGWKAQFVSGIVMPLMGFITNISYVLVSVVGGILVTNRTIQIGDIQAFIQYTRQFSQPITQLANITNIIQSTIASAERIFALMDEIEEDPDVSPSAVVAKPRGHVKFSQVQFRYDADTPLIEDMNIQVQPGQTVAIVGPTGAGKTTLINLLMRFYDCSRGQITIDGVNIMQMTREDLRGLFAMVLQDTWLFHGTIRDNIAFSKANATEEELIQAAKAASADHFIRTLPDGYDTVLNEEASNISQGQKQLLTIARAILADPPILILDEATSSVDTRTEALIQKAMNGLMKQRTSFVIAHRLSTIRHADLILVMNKGTIIEQGTHEQLLEKDGFYADLYNSQFARNVPSIETV